MWGGANQAIKSFEKFFPFFFSFYRIMIFSLNSIIMLIIRVMIIEHHHG